MVARRLAGVGPVAAALALAALWPLTADQLNPLLYPFALALAGAVVLILWRPAYGVALALALTPLLNLTLAVNTGRITLPARPFQILIPLLAGGVLVYGALVPGSARRAPRPRLTWAVLAFVAAGILSSIFALEPVESVNKAFLLVTAATLFLAVFQTCRDRHELTIVLGGVVLALVVASVQGIYDHFAGIFSTEGFISGGEVVGRVQGSFGHPNQYGGYLAVLIPVATAVAFGKDFHRALRWVAGISVPLGLLALDYSYARGAMGGLVVGALIWLTVFKPRAAFGVVVAVVFTVLVIAPVQLKDRFDTQNQAGAVSIRQDIWGGALDIWSHYPLVGAGLDNFPVAYERLPSVLPNASQRRLLHNELELVPPFAQNLYLNVLAEEGMIGLLTLLVLLASGVAMAYAGSKLRDPRGRMLGYGLGVGLMTLILHSLVEVTLLTELALPLFSLLAVMGTWVALEHEAEQEAIAPRLRSVGTAPAPG